MAEKPSPKADQLRAMREARYAARQKPAALVPKKVPPKRGRGRERPLPGAMERVEE